MITYEFFHDCAFVGGNLAKGLKKEGYEAVVFATPKSRLKEMALVINSKADFIVANYLTSWSSFASAIFHPNKTIFIAHGTDVREKGNIFAQARRWLVLKRAKIIFFTTPNLAEHIQHKNKHWLPAPVDTDLFKPLNSEVEEYENHALIWTDMSETKRPDLIQEYMINNPDLTFIKLDDKVPHDSVPELLNKFKYVVGQFSGLLGVSELEILATGRKLIIAPLRPVYEHFYDDLELNREWVIKYHSIPAVTQRFSDALKNSFIKDLITK